MGLLRGGLSGGRRLVQRRDVQRPEGWRDKRLGGWGLRRLGAPPGGIEGSTAGMHAQRAEAREIEGGARRGGACRGGGTSA